MSRWGAPPQGMLKQGQSGSLEVDADQRGHDQGRTVREAEQCDADTDPPDEVSPPSAPIHEHRTGHSACLVRRGPYVAPWAAPIHEDRTVGRVAVDR